MKRPDADMATPAFADSAVAEQFAALPEHEREKMLALRQLIFEIAAETPGVGRLQETLKWGQPAYLTQETRSGSTIRLGKPKEGGIAIYTHCQTTLMRDFQSIFPDEFTYEGNRAIHFYEDEPLQLDTLRLLIRNALTYHQK